MLAVKMWLRRKRDEKLLKRKGKMLDLEAKQSGGGLSLRDKSFSSPFKSR